MFHVTQFTDMAKPGIGKDLLKITYRIKPKSSPMKEEEMDDMEETEETEGGDPGSMLREAADMIDEGEVEEAYKIIDEAVAMCKEMHGGEEEYD